MKRHYFLSNLKQSFFIANKTLETGRRIIPRKLCLHIFRRNLLNANNCTFIKTT